MVLYVELDRLAGCWIAVMSDNRVVRLDAGTELAAEIEADLLDEPAFLYEE
jgi:hypothetical protein